MRRQSPRSAAANPEFQQPIGVGAPRKAARSEWATLKGLLPYLWEFRWRVGLALVFLVAAKAANVGVPIVLKGIVDALTGESGGAGVGAGTAALAVPVALVVGYGLLRLSTTAFTELREYVFAKVTQRTVREIALKVFRHLHALSLRFHLDRQTGGLTRDIERGTRGVSSIVSYTLYSILPTLIEISMVLGYLAWNYERSFTLITLVALAVYIVYTIVVTEWRTAYRRAMNELDSRANVKAVDSLMNYETVKYFGNEGFEAKRYDESMASWERAAIKSQTTLSLLNVGQSAIIAVAVTAMVWRATVGVVDGSMTIGDLVLVNAFMIQLYIPLNFLGMLYREIKQSLADMERLFGLLEQHQEVADRPGARPLRISGATVRFEEVHFAYDPRRPVLRGLSFEVPAGRTVAVVGPSGAGKSTLARLLFRFYDVSGGAITIDGQDIRDVTQDSLRGAIGIVPQDTVLFNDTIRYNIAYGRPDASDEEVAAAARAAQLDGLIQRLPAGWDTPVGERGLKLSGGEKQRVAIARMLLKDPPILLLDEATSSLDSKNEQAIQEALARVAANRSTLVIAHRLSTIVDADRIVVLDEGRIVESGRHEELIALGGRYAQLWEMQGREAEAEAEGS
ncbi:MAG: ABC transporter ATP-binding protein/permease [Burkholderiaceae bacterium]|nr:ABC transporter ATP-binding protein/permease [Burkholderiaceae bacterium]